MDAYVKTSKEKCYEELALRLSELNEQNPFGYYFIGASSSVVLQAANYMVKQDKGYIRSNFFAVDEFIVHLFKRLRKGYKIISQNEEYVLIKSILKKSEYEKFSRSPSIIRETMELIQEINKNLKYKDWGKIQENLPNASFLKYVNDNLFKNRIIDKAYVYNYFIKNEDQRQMDYIEDGELKELLGNKTLVFCGFLDIPDALKEIFQRLIENSKESIFYAIYKDNDLFEDTKKYLTGLCGFYNFEGLKSEEKEAKSEVHEFIDENAEQDWICFKIKELLSNKIKPEEIGVVVQNANRAKFLADKMREYLIPYRLKNNVPLIKSKAIKSILSPYILSLNGYRPQDIVSYMESKNNNTIRNLYVKMKIDYPYTTSIEYAKKHWMEGIETYENFLQKKKESLKNENDEFNMIEKIDSEIESLKNIVKDIQNVFKELKEYEQAKKNIEIFEKKIKEDIEKSKDNINSSKSKMEKKGIKVPNEENRAVKKFERAINSLITIVKSSGIESDIGNVMRELCKIETYIPMEFFNNTVEIFTLNEARYTPKKYLFLSSFVNGEYPNIPSKLLSNKEYYKNVFEIDDPFYRDYKQAELNLQLSLSNCENVYVTYFEEDRNGNPFTPSVMLNKFTKSENNNQKEVGSKDKDRLLKIENSLNKTNALSLAFINRQYPISLKNEIEDVLKVVKKYRSKPEIVNSYDFNEYKVFSFTQFVNYMECPYKYFVNYIMKIEGEEELSFKISALDEGILMHEALETFFKEYKGKRIKELIKENVKSKDELVKDLEEKIEKTFDKYVPDFMGKYLNYAKEKMKGYAEKIINNENKNKKVGKPTEFEKDFEITMGDVRFKGKIDRFDNEAGTKNELNMIFDYKPSNPNNKLKKYQLIIYLLEKFKDGEEDLGASFYSYKEGRISQPIKIIDGNIEFPKKEKRSIVEIEEEFKKFKEKIKAKEFNLKAIKADKWDMPFGFAEIKRDPFEEHGVCVYCPFKNFCDRGVEL